MSEGWGARWLGRHAVVAPFGVLLATVLLAHLSGRWTGWSSLNHVATLVDLGVVLYAMVAVLAERGVRMWFWALDQRRKWREQWRREAQAEGRAEERQKTEAWLTQVADKEGIPIERLLPPNGDAN